METASSSNFTERERKKLARRSRLCTAAGRTWGGFRRLPELIGSHRRLPAGPPMRIFCRWKWFGEHHGYAQFCVLDPVDYLALILLDILKGPLTLSDWVDWERQWEFLIAEGNASSGRYYGAQTVGSWLLVCWTFLIGLVLGV